MNRKTKQRIAIGSCTAALSLLAVLSAPSIGSEPTPQPHIRPVSACTSEDRVTAPPKPNSAPVGEETAIVEPHNINATEIDFEPLKHGTSPAILTSKEPSRDNTTPEPSTPQATATAATAEPQMGDTRSMDGQKQVYILGFGWIVDSDEPNECIMVDGDGDINKMVGTMD